MQTSRKPVSVHEVQRPVATFKKSLRTWQARYKAERAMRMASCQKPPSPAAPVS
jgi:hypothetical protein